MEQLRRSLSMPVGPTSGQHDEQRLSPEGVIAGCAAALPVLAVVAAICQVFGSAEFPRSIFLPFAVLSAFFTTLATCLLAHHFVQSRRRTAVFVEVVAGLSLIWGGFSYFVFGSTFFPAAVEYVQRAIDVSSTPSVSAAAAGEARDHDRARDTPAARDAHPLKYFGPAILLTLLAIPYVVAWGWRNLSAPSRFRILLCVMCLSWFVTAIAWVNASPIHVPSKESTSTRMASGGNQVDTEEIADRPGVKSSNSEGNPWHLDTFAPLVLVGLFAVPLFFSLPFIDLFLVEFVNVNTLGRIWIISTVSSLGVILLISLVAPRLLGDHTPWLSATGLAISVLAAWIILPVIRDRQTSWIALHVCALTFMVGGFVILGRPWTLAPDRLLLLLAVTVPPAGLTLLHLLLGLYSPKKLLVLKRMCWWSIRFAFISVTLFLVWHPPAALQILPAALLTVALVGPYSSTPPEMIYLRHLIARYMSFGGLVELLRGILLRRQEPLTDAARPAPVVATCDPEITAALPSTGAVRHVVTIPPPDWLSPVTLPVVIFAAITTAVTYGFWRSRPEATLQQIGPSIVVSLALIALSAWLLLIRLHLSKQRLLLTEAAIGWWNGSRLEWLIPFDSLRAVSLHGHRLTLWLQTGDSISTRRLAPTTSWPVANYVQSTRLDSMMREAMDQLDQVGSVDFGPLSVSWKGLSVRGRLLPWEDFGTLIWRADGITINNRHGLHYWGHISSRRIPNPLCLQTMLVFLHAVRVFLSSITASLTTNPSDLDRVLRSIRGTDEFRLADENTLVAAMTEVVRYQFPLSISLQLEPSMAGFADPKDTAGEAVVGQAWRELVRRVSLFAPIPAQLQFLTDSTTDVTIKALARLLIPQESPPVGQPPIADDLTTSQEAT